MPLPFAYLNSTPGAKKSSNAAAPKGNVNATVIPPGNQSQIKQLQKYTKERQPVKYTQPGYEILFYSRFGDKSLDLYSNPNNFIGYKTTNQVPNAGQGKNELNGTICKPTFRFFSDTFNKYGPVLINKNQQPVVTNISVHQRVDDSGGSIAAIQMIQPEGVEYFKPTIGFAPPNYPDIDYHTSTNPNDGPTRIGVMDTVIIRLSNNFIIDGTEQRVIETVFRGVVASIRRTKSVESGSTITLQLMDFSEFLRQITGIGLGIFSTSNFNLTGRGYVRKLLEYSNALYSGNQNITNVDTDTTDKIGKQIESSILTALVDITHSPLTNSSNRSNVNHAMSCPPLFWLQYSPQDKIAIDNSVVSDNFNSPSAAATAQTVATTVGNDFQDLITQTEKSIVTDLQAIKYGQAQKLLTPEDQESIKTYNIFGGTLPANIKQSVSSLFAQYNLTLPTAAQLSEIAWALSDIYIQKGIVTFAHEILWQSIYQTASRTFREAYFDFAPKLRSNTDSSDPKSALVPFDTASVAEIVAAGIQGLPDIHPNIGILKYRLSPCFIPYPPVKTAPKGQDVRSGISGYPSNFRFYSFSDEDTIETDFSETEQDVFTAVFGFGNDIGKTSFTDSVKSLLDGQSQALIATAETLDTRIESRLGYRFKSNHDETIRIPVIMYMTSYSVLHKSQANMFQQAFTTPGDPRIQAGSIVQMRMQNADFYCTQVQHTWDLQQGYVSQLQLQYGHTTGTVPQVISGFGIIETENQSTQNGCTLSTLQMQKEGLTNHPSIGGINQDCLIYALQQYMSSVAITNNNATLGSAPTSWYPSGSNQLNDTQLQALWIQAGGQKSLAPIMAWIALGESKGNPNANNPDDNNGTQTSSGLWQVSTGSHDLYPNVFDPFTNAQIAVQKQQESGFSPWELGGIDGDTNDLASCYNAINSRYDGRVGDLLGGDPVFAPEVFTPWPYKVYGIIGMQLTSNTVVSPSVSKSAYKNQLLDQTQGLKNAQTYISYLSTKYAVNNTNFAPKSVNGAPPGGDFSQVNQSDKLAKVIAAWFCDEGRGNGTLNPGFLSEVISQVESLYNTCTTCAASTIAPLNASGNSELNAGSTDRQSLATSKNVVWSDNTQVSDILNSNKTTDNLISLMNYMVQNKGWFVEVTALNSDHQMTTSNGKLSSHAVGKAVDWRPLVTPSDSNFYSPTDPAVQRFIADIAGAANLFQIGLSQQYQTAENINAAGPTYFPDNDQPHIHTGVH